MIVTVTLNPVLDRTLTVPHIVFNDMMRATASRLDWGGKGLNVSRALQALGVDSVAMGLVGGATGQMLERGLNDMGIATDLMPIAGETRTNVVVTDAAGDRYIKVNEAGPPVREEEVAAFVKRVRKKARPGDIWVLSGSLPPGVASDLYAQLVALVQGRGAKVFLDASGEPLRLGCAVGPYLVKPNVVEAQEMTGQNIVSEADALDAMAFFVRQGIELVALSLGADGLLLASEHQRVWARPPSVRVRNPVGAGDALLAGLVWALACPEPLVLRHCTVRSSTVPKDGGQSRRACPEPFDRVYPEQSQKAQDKLYQRKQTTSLEEMARWGVAAGTAAAMCDGVGVGTKTQIGALYDQVRTEPL
jgi:1-phosphofructokinase